MNRKEQQRAMVVAWMAAGTLKGKEGAALVGLTVRQVRRLVAAYRERGVAALAHGNRGRPAPRAVAAAVRAQVVALARSTYAGWNDSHLTEVLAEREGIVLSRSTVRRILRTAGLESPRTRRAPRHRQRRERFPQEGMLLQIDGSHHDWLEGRGPRLALIAAIDDATGTVPYALFRRQEDAPGYFLLLRAIITRKGIPGALYSDNHAVFRVNPKAPLSIEEQLLQEQPLTQFGRALRELGIEPIFALSPQAKGRVERLFGTLQDRLVSELRLAGAKTGEEANQVLGRFLPRFNQRFGVPALQPESAYRAQPVGLDLDHILCSRHPRTVASDNTVRFHGRAFQLLPGPDRISYARAKVDVCEQMDGTIRISYQGRVLPATEAPPLADTLRASPKLPAAVRPLPANARPRTSNNGKAHKPGPDHPWRRYPAVTNSQTS